MIHVIATIRLNSGRQEEFLNIFRQLMPKVLDEEGCLEYGPTVDLATSMAVQGEPREDVVTVVEQWESVEALEKHLVAPHMVEFRSDVKGLVVDLSIKILKPV